MKYADVNALLCELGQDVIIKDPVTGQERADIVIRTADLCSDKVPSPWISVEKALPPPDENVLLLVKGACQYIWYGRCEEVVSNVTHWMPLPDLPEVAG